MVYYKFCDPYWILISSLWSNIVVSSQNYISMIEILIEDFMIERTNEEYTLLTKVRLCLIFSVIAIVNVNMDFN